MGTVDIFEEAQKKILGENHAYPMIAFGTCKKKSAFKLYAKSQNMDFTLANAISAQIEAFDKAVLHAEDDERDEINIYDYVSEEYHSYIDASQKYWGIIMDKKKAPCSYLLYSGDIRREVGLIKCKSESTNKECITTVVDGAVAEKYKFLKNDILKVDVVMLTEMVYKRIGIKPHSVNELMELVEGDQKVWDIYHKGLTIGINQCEKDSTTQKVMKYKPTNISELAAFIAAIRPAFKSMYGKLERRENFSYGIPAFDKILQTKQFPQSFILYQEQTMNTLNYAGFPIGECYGIIKAIAKKHPEKVRPLKARFLDGFKQRIMEDDNVPENEAKEMSEKVWQIISDSCGYGFNSSHAYCMSLDSLYNAWQKAHYPYEFYEVLLQVFSDKGKKDKVALLKAEMLRGFGIEEGGYKYGLDNRKFKADPENHRILPSLISIKGFSQGAANDLYSVTSKLGNKVPYLEVWEALNGKRSINIRRVDILIEIGYFDCFAGVKKLKKYTELINQWYGRSQFRKDSIDGEFLDLVMKHTEDTKATLRKFDYRQALIEAWDLIPDEDATPTEKLGYELEHFGYNRTLIPNIDSNIYFIQVYECPFKNPKLTLYSVKNGEIITVKVNKGKYDDMPIKAGDMIRAVEIKQEGKWYLDGETWKQSDTNFEYVLKKWNLIV